MTINPRLKKIKSIMEKVLDTKRGNIDEKFCQNMIKKNVNKEYITASASVIGKIKRDFISGWIMDFINYDSEGKKIHKKYYKNGYNVKYIPNLQSQIIKAKFILEDFFNTYPMALCAGFLGMNQDQTTMEMSMVIGWYIEDYSKNKIRQDASKLYWKIHEHDNEEEET